MKAFAISALGAAALAAAAPCAWAETVRLMIPAIALDGDSFRILNKSTGRRTAWPDLRLGTIDAPEMRGKCQSERDLAKSARNRLAELLSAPDVRLERLKPAHDRYGRRLVRVRSGGRDVGEALVSEGLARAYAGGARASWCPMGLARPGEW